MPNPFFRAALLTLAFASASVASPAETVRVFAAASLTDALAEVANLARKSGIDMTVNLAGSNTLVRQVIEGARTDMIITADEDSMIRLAEGGRVLNGSIKPLLSNRLVVVAPLDYSDIGYLGELARPRFRRIAIADETTAPAGLYAHKALDAAGLWRTLLPRLVPTENVRGALAAVESGNAQAAIVYRTDAAISSKVRVIWEFHGNAAPEIVYPVAIPLRAQNTEAAGRLYSLMTGPDGRAIFKKFGFEVRATGGR